MNNVHTYKCVYACVCVREGLTHTSNIYTHVFIQYIYIIHICYSTIRIFKKWCGVKTNYCERDLERSSRTHTNRTKLKASNKNILKKNTLGYTHAICCKNKIIITNAFLKIL